LPDWHHPLNGEELMKNVPYFVMSTAQAANQNEALNLATQFLSGGMTADPPGNSKS